MDMFGVAVLIFLVTDPFGNIAVFLAALKGVAPGRRLRVAFRELAFALGLLLLFLTLGEHILSGLGLSREATGIAGGIILFVIAMRLIFPSPQGLLGEVPDGEPLLVPLATPAVAGPSALAMLITLHLGEPGQPCPVHRPPLHLHRSAAFAGHPHPRWRQRALPDRRRRAGHRLPPGG